MAFKTEGLSDVEKQYGKLTIFASYFSGTGKSWRMLETAERVRQAGQDVVIGLLSGDAWKDTRALADRFEMLPCKELKKNGRTDREVNLEMCLKRMPDLILIDDLSHNNIDGARHRKRYQDIEELLKAGIDVYTTLDIHHIESLQDTVSDIFGGTIPDRIPDRIFDQATRVEFVDIEPELLCERLLRQNRKAFPLSQLNALRAVGLRRCADRAAACMQQTPPHTHDQILVCISASPSSERIIRAAAQMANAFQCGLIALFVETKSFQWGTEADREQLQENIRLAQQLGATVETVYGDDVAYQIAEFARLSGAAKIVIGRSTQQGRLFFRRPSLIERLIYLAPALDIHIIPDNHPANQTAAKYMEAMYVSPVSLLDLMKSALILILVTLAGWVFYHFGSTEANVIAIYLLGVMLISVFTKSSVCSLTGSVIAVLAFNFFFTEPRFTLQAHGSDYPVTFLVMFLVSLITGSMAARLKAHAKHSAQVAWRTKLLFETNQCLQKAQTQEEILSITATQLQKIFQRDVVAYNIENGALNTPTLFLMDDTQTGEIYRSAEEKQVAQWVLANNRRAGAGTDNLPGARCTYLSIRTGKQVYGVIGIAAMGKTMDSVETSILLSILGECALALENQNNLEEKEAAAVMAKNEQLRANLLRSISHDLRTPLTAISGNASNLLSNGKLFDEQTKNRMYADIYDDAMWLINLVENLLSVSRLESGRMNLSLSTELIDEVVAEALRHIDRKSTEYHLHVQSSDEFTLVEIDARLIIQVIINIVNNAIKYSPPGSEINIGWKRQGKYVDVSVADNGPGIPDSAKPRIFDMFYSASNRIADSRRSMGLGLALCKSIVNAHGGEITVSDHLPQGSVFTFSIPAGEVELHE